jgi:hypothetical protein
MSNLAAVAAAGGDLFTQEPEVQMQMQSHFIHLM